MHCNFFPLLQHSLQLITTFVTNPGLLPQPHALLLHYTGSRTLAHPQMVLSLSILLPVYISQLISVMKLSSVPSFPSCFGADFCLLSSVRVTKSLLAVKAACCPPHTAYRKQQAGETYLEPCAEIHIHIVGLESQGHKTKYPFWPQLPGWQQSQSWVSRSDQ